MIEDACQARARRLNAVVAGTVVVMATFMGICKVKDDNIVQAMQQAQADKLDHGAFYRARNIRQEVAEATVTPLELGRQDASAASATRCEAAVASYRQLAKEQAGRKAELKAEAEQDQASNDAPNFRDDPFDPSDAAIAMLAVTALTGLWSLYFAALVPAAIGLAMGRAGLAALPWHPGALVRRLS